MSDLPKRLRIKAGMIQLGEHIAWGSDAEIMEEAADAIERIEAERDQLKADSEVVADLAESRLAENIRLKAENDRLTDAAWHDKLAVEYRAELDKLSERNYQLRKSLDEAIDLLEGYGGGKSEIEEWLEANKR